MTSVVAGVRRQSRGRVVAPPSVGRGVPAPRVSLGAILEGLFAVADVLGRCTRWRSSRRRNVGCDQRSRPGRRRCRRDEMTGEATRAAEVSSLPCRRRRRALTQRERARWREASTTWRRRRRPRAVARARGGCASAPHERACWPEASTPHALSLTAEGRRALVRLLQGARARRCEASTPRRHRKRCASLQHAHATSRSMRHGVVRYRRP